MMNMEMVNMVMGNISDVDRLAAEKATLISCLIFKLLFLPCGCPCPQLLRIIACLHPLHVPQHTPYCVLICNLLPQSCKVSIAEATPANKLKYKLVCCCFLPPGCKPNLQYKLSMVTKTLMFKQILLPFHTGNCF